MRATLTASGIRISDPNRRSKPANQADKLDGCGVFALPAWFQAFLRYHARGTQILALSAALPMPITDEEEFTCFADFS
jgi:hypothetical protein